MIHVLLRHCNLINSKPRPEWFDKEAIFKAFLATLDVTCDLTVMFDGEPAEHFVNKYPVDIVKFKGGCDAASFAKCLVYAGSQKNWADDDVVYFVEDDYIHRRGWPQVLAEGMTQGDIVSLFDHCDRYRPGSGACRLTYTDRCHWRTAISTTNTFAVRYCKLMEDLNVYAKFADPSVNRVCVDHEKFLHLFRHRHRVLVTSVPAWSTHCEEGGLSPTINWERVANPQE